MQKVISALYATRVIIFTLSSLPLQHRTPLQHFIITAYGIHFRWIKVQWIKFKNENIDVFKLTFNSGSIKILSLFGIIKYTYSDYILIKKFYHSLHNRSTSTNFWGHVIRTSILIMFLIVFAFVCVLIST